TALNGEASKLNPNNGYTVLLHQAWQQSMGEAPTKIAVSTGNQQFGHYPVEGTLSLKQVRFVDLDANFWINQFDATGLLIGSERMKQSARLKTGEVTYLDHSNLGMLVKISPL
ncbi:MAG: CsiV family protein, partial [Pseudomonas sp.]